MTTLTDLLGPKLRRNADIIDTATLKGKKAVVLYFSAHWCPPCRGFTPQLADAYKAYSGEEADVVFVSSDNGDEEFEDYFKEMPWLALPYDAPARSTLGSRFGVDGIPCLVVLGPDGELLHGKDFDARSLVSTHGGEAFPFTPEHVKTVQAEAEVKAAAAAAKLGDGSIPVLVRATDGGETSLAALLQTNEHVALVFGDGDGDDSTYDGIAKAVAAANAGGPRVTLVYVGHSLYNDKSDHKPFAARFASVLEPSQAAQDAFKLAAGGSLGAPHVLVIAQEAGSCSLDGACTPAKTSLVCSDRGGRVICERGAAAYPWSTAKIAELEAADAARVAAVKASQAHLLFLRGSSGMLVAPAATTQAATPAGAPPSPTTPAGELTVSLEDALARVGSEGIVALYFSAHWCGPCRGFTPKLAEEYTKLKAAGKPFEVVFISSDRDAASFAAYHAEMPWLALPFAERTLKEDLSTLFDVSGIPSLILLRADGSLVTTEGRAALSYGADYFPWDEAAMERGKAEAAEKREAARKAAVAAEESVAEAQRASGGVVLRRLRGQVGDAAVALPDGAAAAAASGVRELTFRSFSTLGVTEATASSGVIYYETTLLEMQGIPQIGFATAAFVTGDGAPRGEGVGDDEASWGLDGVRNCKWGGGGPKPWDCTWAVGDTIGVAANVELGMLAVSKNGKWAGEAQGVVFHDEAIKNGVYPAISASGFKMSCAFAGFKYALPTAEVWGLTTGAEVGAAA